MSQFPVGRNALRRRAATMAVPGVPTIDRPRLPDAAPEPAARSRSTAARDAFAIGVARGLSAVIRRRGWGASSFPGMAASWIAPGVVQRVAAGIGRSVLVSGTNGKTATSSLLSGILARVDEPVLVNASGANLIQGIRTVIIGGATLTGRLLDARAIAVLEADEASLPAAFRAMPRSMVVLTNLFRDQLDRYGETDHVVRLWEKMLAEVSQSRGVVYCVDDPRVAALVADAAVPHFGYGLEGPPAGGSGAQLTPEPATCPRCSERMVMSWRATGHLGSYACHGCGFRRPEPDCTVAVVENRGLDGQTVRFTWRDEPPEMVDLALPGVGNACNAAAAVTAAVALGIPARLAIRALASVPPPFGRFENLEVDGRRLTLALLKNPASMEELTNVAAASHVDTVLLAFNDAFADGRDVSWYWDCSPAPMIAGRRFVVAGKRADDALLRIRYAVCSDPASDPPGFEGLVRDPVEALGHAISVTPAGGTVLAVATYTALLAIRASLVAQAFAPVMPR
jgi:UDP-N-acetylmuramyl tripeptide synthase